MKFGLWSLGISLLLITACNNSRTNHSEQPDRKEKKSEQKKTETVEQKLDTNQAVATYETNTEDNVTNNDFIVKVFPTNTTDVFEIDIQFGGNAARDNVTMVPKAYYKKISLKKGNSDNECILGFIDTEGKFNEMRSITGSSTKIGIKTLKAYYLSTN